MTECGSLGRANGLYPESQSAGSIPPPLCTNLTLEFSNNKYILKKEKTRRFTEIIVMVYEIPPERP